MADPTFTIHVRPDGAEPPADVRVRRLLKSTLRQFALRCTGVTATADSTGHLPQTNTPGR